MMKQPILKLISSLHQPEGWKSAMVYSVWEDGEITLEKGGELFGLRNLHQMEPPLLDNAAVPISFMPVQDGKHARAYVIDREAALTLRNAIAEWYAADDIKEFNE